MANSSGQNILNNPDAQYFQNSPTELSAYPAIQRPKGVATVCLPACSNMYDMDGFPLNQRSPLQRMTFSGQPASTKSLNFFSSKGARRK